MRSKITVLKLGGSVITFKEKPLTPNLQAIDRLANEIFRAKDASLIIVHGGGSFGHPMADEYELAKGYKYLSQIMGFSKTHQAMTTLNQLVIDSLLNHNIPAVEVQPSSCVVTNSGRIQSMDCKPLTGMLEMDFVPVLYGDTVLDYETGFTILSGDQLVSYVAIRLEADRIIVGVDVNGLCTADPKTHPSASLIRHVTLGQLKNIEHNIEGAVMTDVTGGMLGKMRELTPAVEKGVPAIIVNATKSNRVFRALKGEKITGTVIERDGDCPAK